MKIIRIIKQGGQRAVLLQGTMEDVVALANEHKGNQWETYQVDSLSEPNEYGDGRHWRLWQRLTLV